MTRREWLLGAIVAMPACAAAGFLLRDELPASWLEHVGVTDGAEHEGGEAGEAESLEGMPDSMAVVVEVAAVTTGELPITVGVIGRVESLPSSRRALSTRASGRVDDVLVRVGQTISKDDVLMRLDPAPLTAIVSDARAKATAATNRLAAFDRGGSDQRAAELAATRQKADADLKLAEARAERQRELTKDGLVAPSVLQEVEQSLADARRTADIAVRAADAWRTAGAELERATLVAESQAAANTLADAEVVLGAAELKSPAAGRLIEFTPRAGSTIDAGQTLGTLACDDACAIRFDVAVGDGRKIRAGAAVNFHDDDGGGPTGRAHVMFIANEVNSTSGLLTVIADIDEATPAPLPGEIVRAELEIGLLENVCIVPEIAVFRNEDRTVVAVIDTQGIAHVTPVTVLAHASGRYAVEGLHGSERVATKGGYNLPDGARVVVP